MQKLNIGRLVLGGIVAAVIIDVVEFWMNNTLLRADWAAVSARLGLGSITTKGIIAFNLWSLAIGLTAIFLYACLRPRFGPGPKTALLTAAVVWVLGYVLAMVAPVVMHMIPKRLGLISISYGLAEIVVACLAGAALYKEDTAETLQAASSI